MEQFKTLEDLRDYLARLERWFARPIARGEHPTLHPDREDGSVVCGIRRDDYLFSLCGNWILPSREHGLSFSAHWQHLKGIHRMKSKRNPGKAISVHWILEKADIPPGLAFVPDEKDRRHHLLCAVERMRVDQLRDRLLMLADRMSVIEGAEVAL